jgi:hypothetical protein
MGDDLRRRTHFGPLQTMGNGTVDVVGTRKSSSYDHKKGC